jgi:hypothetical protein
MSDIFGGTLLNMKNYSPLTCEELNTIVKSIYNASNQKSDRVSQVMRKMARDLELNIVDEDVYIYRNYVSHIVEAENQRARFKILKK